MRYSRRTFAVCGLLRCQGVVLKWEIPTRNQDMEKPRLFFIDNLRILLITLVMMIHLSITYGGEGSWYYRDGQADTLYQLRFLEMRGNVDRVIPWAFST